MSRAEDMIQPNTDFDGDGFKDSAMEIENKVCFQHNIKFHLNEDRISVLSITKRGQVSHLQWRKLN